MLKAFRTLKARLTLYHVLIFGLLQAALWITVDVVRTSQLRRRFELELVDRGQGVARLIGQLAEETGPGFWDSEALSAALRSYFSPRLFMQVSLSPDLTFKSPSLSGFQLPLPPADKWLQDQGDAVVKRLSGEPADTLGGPGSVLKMATLYETLPGNQIVCVQVAADAGPVENSITATRILLVIFTATSLIVAAVTSWFLVERSLSPVGAVVRKARRIGAAKLHERIARPETDDEISQMIDVINGMLDRLEAEFKNQQQFISHSSHEIKTPLTVILTEAQALAGHSAPVEQYQQFVDTIRDEARRLLRIVDSFLLLTRARSGTRPAVELPVPVEDMLIEAARRTWEAAQEAGVRVVPKLNFTGENPEPVVSGDTDLLYTMVENLVRNAIRHSPPGEAVEIIAEATSKEAVVAVRDRGDGIPPDHLHKVFALFHQVSPQSGKAGKLGVGLSIARAVAELHGGAIAARNRDGGGAEFTIRLPLAERP